MKNLNDLNLKYNPFVDLTPNMNNPNLVWAEMEVVKSKISRSYNDCIINNSKQIILNWGPYGGGKTFSAYYFKNQYNEKDDILHIIIRTPKEGSISGKEFFKNIIDFISFERISEKVAEIIERVGEAELISFLTSKSGSELAKAICLFGSRDKEKLILMNRFLYSGLTKTELKKLELAKDIQTATDSIKFLAGIFSCFIESRINPKGRLILWLDEMEDLIYYQPKYYKSFSQILRDLFDNISNGFLVFLNFTLAEGEETTIELILGGAMWSRITKKIRYIQFTKENAISYCTQLIDHAIFEKSKSKPFTSLNISRIVDLIPENNLTPRELNKHFRSIILYVQENEIQTIDDNILNNWIEELEEDI